MSGLERETKISNASAEDEARMLLQKLRHEPDRAESFGNLLNERYSAAPRKLILSQLRNSIPRTLPIVSSEALFSFLGTQIEGVKDLNFEEHFQEVLAVAIEIPGDEGIKIAAELVAKTLCTTKYPVAQLGKVTHASAILAIVFEQLCRHDKKNRELLIAWTEAALSLFRVPPNSGPSFRPDHAASILNTMARVDRKILPNSLLACVPSLILIAGKQEASAFLASAIGLPFAKSFSGWNQNHTREDDAPLVIAIDNDKVISPRELLSESLKQVLNAFDRLVDENKSSTKQLREEKEEALRQLDRAAKSNEERERQIRILRTEHHEELNKNQERIKILEIEERKLTESVDRLRADLKLSDHNAHQNATEKDAQHRRRLGEMLGAALGSMRRDLEQALRKHPDNEMIRNVGITFDTLHRKLLREATHLEETRLPRELLDPKNAQ